MGLFNRKPTQQKYIDGVVKVASNLYLNSISGRDSIGANFQFKLKDSRYRYLIFCLSAVFTSVLVYDEKKSVKPEELFEGCILFAIWTGTNHQSDYFDGQENIENSIASTKNIFNDYLKLWSSWPSLEKEGRNNEINNLICTLIHLSESDTPISNDDSRRLGELSLEIDSRLPTMRAAVEVLARR